ncbi:MAG: hypothetical protein IKZ28_04415, partial [Clostridia bacterium]|nr:hypothetical protein [Clostridia bacterium]
MMKKQLLLFLASLSVACVASGIAFSNISINTADAENSASRSFDFTDTMDATAFKAPASHFGWKVTKGTLSPDNSQTETAQIGYFGEAIALNETKYISFDFYATDALFDVALVPYEETVNPWATGIAIHSNLLNVMTLNGNIDLGPAWMEDSVLVGNCVDGYAHKLEIYSDGTNLTFAIDGISLFTSTVAIPSDNVRL